MNYARIVATSLVVAQSALAQAGARPVAVIGGDRSGRIELENPRDILTIGNRIVVLDANEPFLKVFDFTGRAIQATVKKGSGPGEISAAHRFAADSATGRIYTIDVLNLRTNVYTLRDTLSYETTIGLPGHTEDACVVGGHLFTLGMFGSHLMHELEPKNGRFDFVRTFAVPRADPQLDANPNFQIQVAKGRLACDTRRQRLVAISQYAGVAQVVDLRTLTQQTIKLAGLTPITFAQVGTGAGAGVSLSARNGYDIVQRVEVTAEGVRFFADHLAPGHKGSEDFTSVAEWLVLPNGTLRKGVVSRQREVGRNGNRVACFVGSPVPTIEIYQATRCP